MPRTIAGLEASAEIRLGETYAFARDLCGSVHSWGYGISGQLGRGIDEAYGDSLATLRFGQDPIVQLDARSDVACAVDTHGSVFCWGQNTRGQTGVGWVSRAEWVPVRVEGLPLARLVVTGRSHACALTLGDQVFCWGANDRGQLGDGTTDDRAQPRPVIGL